MADNPFGNVLREYSERLLKDEEADVYEAVGRFLLSYAEAETQVHELARKLSGLRDDKARIIFAKMQLGAVLPRLRALLLLSRRGKKTKDDIEACLGQLEVIAQERHKFMHRSADYLVHPGVIRVTNEATAKSLRNTEQDQFSLTDLKAMHLDCLCIGIRLLLLTHARARKSKTLSVATKKFAYKPWRYKPSARKGKKPPALQDMIAALMGQSPEVGPPAPLLKLGSAYSKADK